MGGRGGRLINLIMGGVEGRDRRDGQDATESSPCRHSLEYKISRSLLVLFRSELDRVPLRPEKFLFSQKFGV